MSDARGVIDFLALEAHEYLERLDGGLAGAVRARAGAGGRAAPPDAAPFARDARALRGAASMARRPEFAALAGAIERAGAAVRDGRLALDAAAIDGLAGAVDACKLLVRALSDWGPAESARARAHTAEIDALLDVAAAPAGPAAEPPLVPVGALAPGDPAQQLVYRSANPPDTADRRFREAAGPIAATLRRLVAEARTAVATAPTPAQLDAARTTLGADLGAAMRDLRDLADSYAVQPVARFAAVREAPLAALDTRTLELVATAIAALLEVSARARRRPTPARAAAAVGTPGDVAQEPGAGGDDGYTPPTGPALVSLLETGIARFGELGALADDEGGEPAGGGAATAMVAPPAPAGVDTDAAESVVPVEQLLYRGRAALDRARDVRDRLRATAGAPDPALLHELYDLLELAVTD
jgi:hypothetical protein